MKRCWKLVCFAALALSAGLAQQKKAVPPPPKPKDEGPSLEATMKFVADKISQEEKISYAVHGHDSLNNSDSVNEFAYETTSVKATPVPCRIEYHRSITKNGQLQISNDSGFELVTIQDVAVMTLGQAVDESDADNGHPARSSNVNPPAWVMRVRRRLDGTDSGETVKRYHIQGNDLDVAITRNPAGGNYHYRLDFAAPPAKKMPISADSVQLYGFHGTVTGNTPAPAIPAVTGHWSPGNPVHLEFDVVKQATDFSQGWSLFLCIGTGSSCIPSPNLLEFSPPRAHEFLFRDEEMANRVAKAMTHAIELCGGGSKDPF